MMATEAREFPDQEDTSLGVFYDGSTMKDILHAAGVARKLGYEPELRWWSEDAIELYVQDTPSLIKKLRDSIAANPRRST